MPKKRKKSQQSQNAEFKSNKEGVKSMISKEQFQTQFEQLFQTDSQKKKTETSINKFKFNQVKQKISKKRTDLYQGIFFLSKFLTLKECKTLIALTNSVGYVETNQKETRWSAHRKNGRLQVQSDSVAESLFQRLQSETEHFPPKGKSTPIGLSSNFRFYKYEPGDRFGMHIDDSIELGHGTTHFTLLFYLNSDFDGGSTKFYEGSNPKTAKCVVDVIPEEGGALVHSHFPTCLLHEGSQVTSGIKYLMRTDVVFTR
jgi:prolyl 4-hydroxylase